MIEDNFDFDSEVEVVDSPESENDREICAEHIQRIIANSTAPTTENIIPMMAGITIMSPWVNWTNSVRELFKQDPDITKMTWDDQTKVLEITVKNPVKRLAIRELLPETKMFNNVKVTVKVVQANRRGGDKYIPEIIAAAFEGNPLYAYMHIWDDPEATHNPYCWVEFAKEVLQYPSDNLHALYGDRSVLPAELAKEVLGEKTDYIFFDTVNPDRPIPEK